MNKTTKILLDNDERIQKLDKERGRLDKQLSEIRKRKQIIAKKISKLMKDRNNIVRISQPEELIEYQQIIKSK